MISRSKQSQPLYIYLSMVFLLAFILTGCMPDDGLPGNSDTTPTPTPEPTQVPANNQPPIARITAPQDFSSGQTVTLDGSSSSDPDGDALNYQWVQTEGPKVALSNRSSSKLTFNAPTVSQPTQFTFQLTVDDGYLSSKASVQILVSIDVTHTSIHVSGSEVYEGNGSVFSMRGINVPHAWYPDKTNTALSDIAKTGANSVRIVISSGHRWNKTSESTVRSLIEQAKANKLIAVLEVHDTTGYGEQTDATTLSQAVDYWKSIQGALIGQEDYVIINIGNEPLGNNQPDSTWSNGHIDAIKSLRSAGLTHAIMVDAPNWGQDWKYIMRDNAASVLAADPLKNVIFSVHMYQVYNQASTISSYMSDFKEKNLALVVGEFAADHQGADVDETSVLNYARQYGYGYLGWSWSGNSAGLESLDIAQDFNASTLSSWGETLINGVNGIRETSATGTIFDSGSIDPLDTDGDGIDNDVDTDDDGDGVLDVNDAFPLDSTESEDTDADGIGNNADPDDDNDGVNDIVDEFPLDSSETLDTDGDGTGNNADADDDNDGFSDIQEEQLSSDPYDDQDIPNIVLSKLYTFEGEDDHGYGRRVEDVGDLNGDGYSEIITSSFEWDDYRGRVDVYSGATGTKMYALQGDAKDDYFGYDVNGAGDVNADGYADFVVSRYRDNLNQFYYSYTGYTGEAKVYSGRNGQVLYSFVSDIDDEVGDHFGEAATGAGDVNNDGFDDVIVGASYDEVNGVSEDTNSCDFFYCGEGSALIFSGKDGSRLYKLEGNGGLFGGSVAALGDVDGDGFDDVAVGAKIADFGDMKNVGMVRVYSGKDGNVLYELYGDQKYESFGISIKSIGDINYDGSPDFAVGAPYNNEGGKYAGKVKVISGVDGKIIFEVVGAASNDMLGMYISNVSDVNGDCIPDIAIGLGSYNDSVRAQIVSGVDGAVLYTMNGGVEGTYFGISVSGLSDINGDGLGDLIVGLPVSSGSEINTGKVYIYVTDSDEDGDGFGSLHDDFPQDPNEWKDTDEDGVGNNADADDDNDGMPDVYENMSEGLDPLVDDANGDLDNDGISNIDEYLVGLIPVFNNDPLVKLAAQQDQPYSDSLVSDASDANGDSLYFSKVTGPAWLYVDSDGTLSGTPGSTDVGINTFIVEVSDGNLSSRTSIIITVNDSMTPIILSKCDFELGMGDWSNVAIGDNKNWTLNLGGTNPSGTGPTVGSNGSAYYMYFGASFANTSGDTAILEGPGISGSNIHLSFQYHMYGVNTGTLAVDVLEGGYWIRDVWSISGAQQSSNDDVYTKTEVDLSAYTVSKVRFRATSAGGFAGDIAIDNVVLFIPAAQSRPIAPVFVSDPVTKHSAVINLPYSDSIAVNATDENEDILTFRKVSGPAWLNVAPNGSLAGTPSSSDMGNNSFVISVSDGELSNSATLNIAVLDALSAEVFPAIAGDGVDGGSNYGWVVDGVVDNFIVRTAYQYDVVIRRYISLDFTQRQDLLGMFEFQLPEAITNNAANVVVESATLELDVDGTSSGTVYLHGYLGNGTIELSDFAHNNQIASVFSPNKRITVDVTSFVNSVVGHSDYVGFLLKPWDNNYNMSVGLWNGTAHPGFGQISGQISHILITYRIQ